MLCASNRIRERLREYIHYHPYRSRISSYYAFSRYSVPAVRVNAMGSR
jgi:hypothetical protein